MPTPSSKFSQYNTSPKHDASRKKSDFNRDAESLLRSAPDTPQKKKEQWPLTLAGLPIPSPVVSLGCLVLALLLVGSTFIGGDPDCAPPILKGTSSWRRAARLAVNYAQNCCNDTQPVNCEQMIKHGAHRCISFSQADLDPEFVARNQKILSQERGAGYWLWKPYIILKTMLEDMNDGDLVLYSDSKSKIIGDLRPLYELAHEDDIVIFQTPQSWHLKEKQWTKPDAFVLLGCPVEECGALQQVIASISVWRKTFRSIQFLSQWLTYMEDERVSTDLPSTLVSDTSGFADHRHDQSCLGLLAHRWNLTLYNFTLAENSFQHHGVQG